MQQTRGRTRAALPLRALGAGEYEVAGRPVTRRAGNVLAYRVSTALARYCAGWMERLGLCDIACYLAGEDLPIDVGGEMWLACLAGADLVPVNLCSPQEFVRRASTGDFDLLMITVALRQLKRGVGHLCPLCLGHDHPLVHHIILHELVHAAYPERAWDNPWTDRRVAELLVATPSHVPLPGDSGRDPGAAATL